MGDRPAPGACWAGTDYAVAGIFKSGATLPWPGPRSCREGNPSTLQSFRCTTLYTKLLQIFISSLPGFIQNNRWQWDTTTVSLFVKMPGQLPVQALFARHGSPVSWLPNLCSPPLPGQFMFFFFFFFFRRTMHMGLIAHSQQSSNYSL